MSWLAIGQLAFGALSRFGASQASARLDKEAAAKSEARGGRDKAAAYYEAEQYRQQASAAQAYGQITAAEERRQAKLAISRTLAVAAASGAGASDPTVVNLVARQAGEGAYRSSVALWEGEDRARQYRMSAEAREYEGDRALIEGGEDAAAYRSRARSTRRAGTLGLIADGLSLYSKYGRSGPEAGSGDDNLVEG